MNRMQFSLTPFLAGFCLAFLASSQKSSAQEPVWDPQEAKSNLFTQQEGPPAGKDITPDVSSTVSKWRRLRIAREVREVRSATREPLGARVSLVAFATTSSTYQDCPGPDHNVGVFASVINGGGYSNKCSTQLAMATNCSVEDSSSGGACSTDSNGNMTCSAIGGSSYDCSAIDNSSNASCSTNGSNVTCSTNSESGGSLMFCSALYGQGVATGQSCSTGSLAGGGDGRTNSGQAGSSCSALGTSGGNFCSVYDSGTTGADCSADGSTNTSCSAFSNGGAASDVCSVTANQANPISNCTVIGENTGNAFCSAAQGSNGRCSTQQADGSVSPPGPNGACSAN